MNPELLLRAAALKVISVFTKERYELARAEVAESLHAGDRMIARSPLDGAKLGAVYMTDPKPVATVTDEAALVAWLREHKYRDEITSTYEVVGSAEEVERVLFDHAPHLLKPRAKLTSAARKQLLTDALALGQPVGPGGEMDVPGISISVSDPVATCKPDDDGLLAVFELFHAGRLELDGTLKPELEAGSDA